MLVEILHTASLDYAEIIMKSYILRIGDNTEKMGESVISLLLRNVVIL